MTHKVVVIKKPIMSASFTVEDNAEIGRFAFEHYGRTETFSLGDLQAIMVEGNSESLVYVVNPVDSSQADTLRWLNEEHIRWEPLYTDPAPVFSSWPTNWMRITQWFGDNPDNYAEFGLPGHEGVDFYSPAGSIVCAAADGNVYQVETNPASGNYGIHIKVDHGTFKTYYCHLESTSVGIGPITGGKVIGKAGNTGHSFGAHLHLTLKGTKPYVDDNGTMWPNNIQDPWGSLERLFLAFIKGGTDCWVWEGSVRYNMNSKYAFTLGVLNAREKPTSLSPVLFKIPTSHVLKVYGDSSNGYIKIRTKVI